MDQNEKSEGLKRVQLDFTVNAYNELVALQKETGFKSKAEIIRYALSMLQWASDEIGKGGKILIEKNNNFREVIIPFIGQDKKLKRGEAEQDTNP